MNFFNQIIEKCFLFQISLYREDSIDTAGKAIFKDRPKEHWWDSIWKKFSQDKNITDY